MSAKRSEVLEANGGRIRAELRKHKEAQRLAALCAATGLTAREGDQALKWLKREGLVRFARDAGTCGWVLTKAGTAP